MESNNHANHFLTQLLDESVPFEHRRAILSHFCENEDEPSAALLKKLFSSAANGNGENQFKQRQEQLENLLKEIQRGALRPATFIDFVDTNGSGVRRAQVVLIGGEPAYPVIDDDALAGSLACGDAVLVDSQARLVLYRDTRRIRTGEEARLERRLGRDRVEVVVREHEYHVLQLADILREKLDAGEVKSGARLLVCTRQMMAFDVVPAENGLSHYRFLDRGGVPDVEIARDIGDPPPFLDRVLRHTHRELVNPELGRAYRRRRASTTMLVGVSGSGKTHCIGGLIRAIYEMMSALTGVPVEQLPPRVLKMRPSQILSKWLGDSDKSADRFFDEVIQLADEEFVAPDGRRFELPVIAIGEEIEGLARSRGSAGDAVYDRIEATILERLDMSCKRLADRLVIMLFTTNVPNLVDSAFLRRAGGTIERFGRLTRRGFAAVLEKHLRDLPIADDHGADQKQRERRLLAEVTTWLFGPRHADAVQVELTYVNSAQPVPCHRRDFLTAGLVDRAVQQAADEACDLQQAGEGSRHGLTRELLLAAFDHQVRAIVDQLTPENVGNYVTLRDGERVGIVRRAPRPALANYELERTA